ncbi:MAG: ABC transporter permease [Thermomicrobiales bacterium]|nr:ABC transporter permease [Thermomicrobiales bacterium]
MSSRSVLTLTQRELLDALRNRWFIVYAAAFLVLCISLAAMIVNSAGYAGISGFGRTAAGLINLVLFLAPLMGLTLGAQSLSAEREQGTLAYLLAQPVSLGEIFLAKFLGLAIAIAGAIAIGFSISSLAIMYWSGGAGVGIFLRLLPLTLLLGWTTLAIGFVISAVSDKTVSALGIGVVAWLLLVLIGDLGLMGASVAVSISPGMLLTLTIVNPLESFRIASILQLRNSIELLGPSGLVANDRFGDLTLWVLVGVMIVWLTGATMLAYVLARRRELQ